MNTRQEKIKFLRELANGKAKLSDILPKIQESWIELTDTESLEKELYQCEKMIMPYHELMKREIVLHDRVNFIFVHKLRKISQKTKGYVSLNISSVTNSDY